MKKILFLAAALVAFASCTEKPDNTKPVEPKDNIELDLTEFSFEKEGGVQPVVVTSTGEWTLTSETEYTWISADVKEGADGDVVTFTAEQNYTGEDLTAVFKFTCGKAEATFTATSVSGEPRTLTLVSAAENDLKYTTTEFVVSLGTNVDKAVLKNVVSYEGEESDWITYTLSTDGEENVVNMIFTLTENMGTTNRSGKITITDPVVDNTVEVSLTQRAKPFITAEVTEYIFAPEGETLTAEVNANVEYDITVSEDWLTFEGLAFTAAAFEGKRYATATLTEKNPLEGEEAVTITLNFTQAPPALISKALDLTGAGAYPVWNSETVSEINGGGWGLVDFTLEALVKANEFRDGVNTLFGISDETFFVRVGDLGIPANQIQVIGQNGSKMNLSDNLLNTDQWYHIAIVHVYTEGVHVYIDGVKVASGKPNGSYSEINLAWRSSYDNHGFWLGFSYEAGRDWQGLMSEVRLWTKALTSDEINAENHFYNIENPTSVEGLGAYWKMDAISAEGIVTDASGNGHNLHVVENVRNDSGTNWAWDGDAYSKPLTSVAIYGDTIAK